MANSGKSAERDKYDHSDHPTDRPQPGDLKGPHDAGTKPPKQPDPAAMPDSKRGGGG